MTEVRHATPEDVLLLQAIEDAADERFHALFEPQDWSPASDGRERVRAPGFLLVAAEEPAGRAVGFVHVLEVDAQAHLEQLSVLPAHGRRGHGRALVSAALREAGERGRSRVTLRTWADVPWNAPFYRASGFVESEPDTPFLRGLVQVERRLGLPRHGRRVQMTVPVPPPSVGTVRDG